MNAWADMILFDLVSEWVETGEVEPRVYYPDEADNADMMSLVGRQFRGVRVKSITIDPNDPAVVRARLEDVDAIALAVIVMEEVDDE